MNINKLKVVQIDAELYDEALQDFMDGLEAEHLKNQPKKEFDAVAKRILGLMSFKNHRAMPDDS